MSIVESPPPQVESLAASVPAVACRSIEIDGVRLFYREAGSDIAPVILLLHGFPSSSFYYRNLIPRLAYRYHVIAPDYPGFGHSDCPEVDKFEYTFSHLTEIIESFVVAKGISKCVVYMQDYGGPVGMRLAVLRPDLIDGLIFQNANAYQEGLMDRFLVKQALWKKRNAASEAPVLRTFEPDAIKWVYTRGSRHPEELDPDGWTMDAALIQRPGNKAIQLELQADYDSNLLLYPDWHAWLRKNQPPALVVWGQHDPVFGAPGAEAFRKDLPNAEIHLLDTGHFALEEDVVAIAELVGEFMERNSAPPKMH
jgi:pimeloyl-ACP methyl ester carboxylesterase